MRRRGESAGLDYMTSDTDHRVKDQWLPRLVLGRLRQVVPGVSIGDVSQKGSTRFQSYENSHLLSFTFQSRIVPGLLI